MAKIKKTEKGYSVVHGTTGKMLAWFKTRQEAHNKVNQLHKKHGVK